MKSYRIRAARSRAGRARKVNIIISLAAAVMVLITLFSAVLMFHMTSRADSGAAAEYKYYTQELITADHTLEDIARRNLDVLHYSSIEDYVREVASINHLSQSPDGSVYAAPGNYVIVPYYSSELK